MMTLRLWRLARVAIATAAAAMAAWLSQGAIALTHAGGDRLLLLPVSAKAGVFVLIAAVGVATLLSAGAPTIPLALLAFLLLPWVPGNIAPVFLLWLGPLTLLVWAGIAWVMLTHRQAASTAAVGAIGPRSAQRRTRLLDALARRPALAAGAIAFGVYAVAAWQVSPSIPAGDEPHYLVITQSLLRDGDVRIANNHRRGDYLEYYAGPLQPDYRRTGRHGQIYSIHPPGISAFVAPAYAVGGYRAVIVFLVLVAAAGTALAWHLARVATGSAAAAWFGWAAVTLSATSIFHSFTVYPDGPGGVLVLTGVWALVRASHERESGAASVRPWLWHGTALAALPWFHSRFALFAGTLGALILLRLAPTRNAAAKAVAFLSVPALSALCWIGYFVMIYGTPDPSAPYAGERGSFSFVPGGLVGLLFDQRFGLLAYAPVLIVSFAGLAIMIARRQHARLALEMLFVVVPYLLTVTHFAMWWGGWSAPARFAAPVLPMLAIPAAVSWASIRRVPTRIAVLALLAFTALASVTLVFVDGGRLAYNLIREPAALWLRRANEIVDIAGGLPVWSRTADAPLFRDAALWIATLAVVWAVLRWTIGRPHFAERRAAAAATLTIAMYALGVMAALTIAWRVRGSPGVAVAAAQTELLRRVSRADGFLAVQMNGPQLVSRDNIPGRLRIELSRDPQTEAGGPRGSGRDVRPLFAIPAVPAGEYLITPVATDARGWVMVGVGRDQFALRTEPLSAPAPGIELRVAANVRELVVRGDEEAREVVRGLRIEPLALTPQRARATNAFATRAVKYADTTVFFLDDGTFAEPEAFWVRGGRRSSIVIQPAAPAGAVELLLRNAPVENRVHLETAMWREDLRLAPGAERNVRVPLDASRDATLLRMSSSAGFRPSAVDANSRDDRYLGVWIRVVNPEP